MSAYFLIQPLSTFLNMEVAQWNLIPDKLQILIQKVDDCFRIAQPEAGLQAKIESQLVVFLLDESLGNNLIPFDRLKSIDGLGRVRLNFPLILVTMQRKLEDIKLSNTFQNEKLRRDLVIEENQETQNQLEILIECTHSVEKELRATLERSNKIIENLQLKVLELSEALKSQEIQVARYNFLPSLQTAAKIGAATALSGVLLFTGYNFCPGFIKKGTELAFKMFSMNVADTVHPATDPILKNIATGTLAFSTETLQNVAIGSFALTTKALGNVAIGYSRIEV